ncbi:hypothetical protein TNCV_3451511 [Trichonephila clavipes]|nr:hypothetical protein TNCV_3451511 [Trichonephila clavipes]
MNINIAPFSYSRVFGDGPRNFEPWTSQEDDTRDGIPSPNYHSTSNGKTFELSTDLICIDPLHGGSSEVPDSNS